MKKDDNSKTVIIFLIIVLLISGIIFVHNYIKSRKDNLDPNYELEIKKYYDVNEFIPVYVDDEQMSKKYLNDFITNIYLDFDGSYKLLNKQYRAAKFGTVAKYKEYIESLDLTSEIDKYAVYGTSDSKTYDIYDKNGNRYIFKTSGVMQYEVMFDDYTI